MPKTILLFEDKLGVTPSYKSAWDQLLIMAGLQPAYVRRVSAWRSNLHQYGPLVKQFRNRKAPAFNDDPLMYMAVSQWVDRQLELMKPDLVLCSDPAVLGQLESNIETCTIDNLRGGVYQHAGVTWLVTVPISAIHSKKKPKDIQKMNEGALTREEYEKLDDRDEDDMFIEPYTVPYGTIILGTDLKKAARLLRNL